MKRLGIAFVTFQRWENDCSVSHMDKYLLIEVIIENKHHLSRDTVSIGMSTYIF